VVLGWDEGGSGRTEEGSGLDKNATGINQV